MSDLIYREETHRLIGQLGNGHDEVIYKDALVVELSRATIPSRVIWKKILFEAKAVEKLTDAHVKQVLNYLAASKLKLGLLVSFGGDSLEWKRVIL